jgi:hypothetical protein
MIVDFAAAYRDCDAILDGCHHEPEHTLTNGRRVCCACWNTYAIRRRAIRKAQLAAAPRCEVCTRRGTVRTCGVLLCGQHFARAERAVQSDGGLFGTVVLDRESLLALVRG